MQNLILDRLNREFNNPFKNIENLIKLYKDGNTVPFIARYRKEQTGAMNEIVIRAIIERYEYLDNLENRKLEVISLIDERGKLTDELRSKVLKAETLTEVEDLYSPYKSKKKTKADIARESGLGSLAEYMMSHDKDSDIFKEAYNYINDKVSDEITAIKMASDIIIELIGHDTDVKDRFRQLYRLESEIRSSKVSGLNGTSQYESYYEYSEKVATIPPHRTLAIFRGEKEGVLCVAVYIDEEVCLNAAESIYLSKGYCLNKYTKKAVSRAVKTVLMPSVELEIRAELREKGEQRAIEVFADNLKRLIMTPPVKGRRVLGLDPAFRTGCKYAAVDDTGLLLDYGVIYPTAPQEDYDSSKIELLRVIDKHKINAIAIGNGTASRETEEFVSRMISDACVDVSYTIVSEAGASVYSASDIAAKEFPEIDVSIRGAISIARRVIDPLAELVKIEPQSIGVGMYQHDVNKKNLEKTLKATVEDVVNNVGVDLNTASASLLSYVAGLTSALALKIVQYRESVGKFMSREALLNISGIGEAIFRQCAGFLKIYGGISRLDSMFIHPESYGAVENLLSRLNISYDNLNALKLKLKGKNISELARELNIGEYTLYDILENLSKPDRDIRDDVEAVVFKKDVVNIDNISKGMILEGKITNVVDFGAFVDLGLKNDGLIHISELADHFVKSPKDIVGVGQKVKVKVLSVDKERNRLSLSMRI